MSRAVTVRAWHAWCPRERFSLVMDAVCLVFNTANPLGFIPRLTGGVDY